MAATIPQTRQTRVVSLHVASQYVHAFARGFKQLIKIRWVNDAPTRTTPIIEYGARAIGDARYVAHGS